MDKNTIIGIVLIAGIFIIWGIFNKPSAEERQKMAEEAKRKQDSIELVREIEQKEAELAALKEQQGIPAEAETAPVISEETPALELASDTIDFRTLYLENE